MGCLVRSVYLNTRKSSSRLTYSPGPLGSSKLIRMQDTIAAPYYQELQKMLDATSLENDADYILLSLNVASESEITPCNKIDKPLVVYRFTGNVMTSITTLRT